MGTKSIIKSNPARYRLSLSDGARDAPVRKLGVGVGACDDSTVCGILRDAMGCSINRIPAIVSTTWDIDGPIGDKDLQETFGGPNIQVWGTGSGNNNGVPGIAAVQNSVPNQNGILQTGLIVLAVGFNITAEPLCGTAEGNAVFPLADTTRQSPPSLDVFTCADTAGALCLAEGQTMTPATMSWGWPMQYAAWHFTQATNFDWVARSRYFLMSEPLRNLAHFGGNGGGCTDGAAGTSQVDVLQFMQRVNAHYQQVCGCGNNPSAAILPINRRRQGLFAGTSAARGTRDYELMSVSYGLDLQAKCGNPMYRQLPTPYFIPANSPIIAQLSVADEVEHANFMQQLSITDGFGGNVPPVETADPRIAAGCDCSFPELSLDSPPVAVAQSLPVGRMRFKGGSLLMSMSFLGYEVTDDFQCAMQTPAMKAALASEFGIQFCS